MYFKCTSNRPTLMFSFTVCICCTEIAVLEGRGVSVYRDRNIQHRPFLNNQTEFQQGIVSVWKQQCACVFTTGTQMVCECSLPVSAIVLFSLSWHYYWMGAAGHVHVNVHKTQWAWLWAGCIKMNKDVILCRKCALNVPHLHYADVYLAVELCGVSFVPSSSIYGL